MVTTKDAISVEPVESAATGDAGPRAVQDVTDAVAQARRAYYAQNRARILEKRREHYREHKQRLLEYSRDYYQQNKDKIRQKSRRWYDDNRDRKSEYWKEYYQRHRETVLARNRQRYLARKATQEATASGEQQLASGVTLN